MRTMHIFVNRVIEDNLSHAVSIEDLRKESKKDSQISKLMGSICKSYCPDDGSLDKAFKQIYKELWATDGILMRGHQIVVPESLQARLIATANQGHKHSDKALKLLRQTYWFPKMNKAVSESAFQNLQFSILRHSSKYPEVGILKPTSFKKFQSVLDRIFNTWNSRDIVHR